MPGSRGAPPRLAVALAGLAVTLAACSSGDAATPTAPGAGSAAPAAGSSTSAPERFDAAASWYVAMGDSIAAGYRPGIGDDPQTGYAGLLRERLARDDPSLRLEPLGCSGETVPSMLAGGRCSYERGNQLAQALAFLRAHPGRVRLVTIDIGVNDVLGCARDDAGEHDDCLTTALPRVRAGLARALRAIRAAAPDVPVVGMTYYDPLLASWLLGGRQRRTARTGAAVVERTNAALTQVYRAGGAEVADVADAFHTGDTTLVPTDRGSVPRDVDAVCRLTYMCTDTDIHPNGAGHRVIADAFAARLDD